MNAKENITSCFVGELKFLFEQLDYKVFEDLEEIRLRAEKPLILKIKNKEKFLSKSGTLEYKCNNSYMVSQRDIQNTLERISDYSIYSVEEELKNGFITIDGGHRIGISGSIIMENNKIKGFRNVTGMNIRKSSEYKGCADKVINYIVNKDIIKSTMIISPPGCGKTTILRDIIRQLSDGKENFFPGMNVSIVDERNEISASYNGIPQKDVGIRTDVLSCCKKASGMLLLLRSMAPKVIAVDEIGGQDDTKAIEEIMNCGVKIICTAHGSSVEEIMKNPDIKRLLEKKVFEVLIVLTNKFTTGGIEGVYDENLQPLALGG